LHGSYKKAAPKIARKENRHVEVEVEVEVEVAVKV
jgi:hypothetical protein